MSALKTFCENRKKTYFNAKDYRIENNKGCPTGYYGICRPKDVNKPSAYKYPLRLNDKIPVNTSSLQESGKEMCEALGDAVWESAK